jgi:hypothetical protein
MLLEPYLERALGSLLVSYDKVNAGKYRFRCNVCGDSPTKKYAKRAAIILSDKGGLPHWVVTCFRPECELCGNPISAAKWLNMKFPDLYDELKNEIKSISGDSAETKKLIESKKEEAFIRQKIREKKIIKEQKEKEDKDWKEFQNFKSIRYKCNLSILAKKYCENRKIPLNVIKKFMICEEGRFKNRLIIPFYNKENKIIFWQGRTLLKDCEPKYLNSSIVNKPLYNIDFIDINKPIIVFEGPIDSLFVENAVATTGANISANSIDFLDNLKEVYYIFDNDLAGASATKKYIEKDKNCFLWFKFLSDFKLSKKIKDFNDVYLALNRTSIFTFKELKPYFSNNELDIIFL